MSLVPYLHRVAAGADLTSAEAHAAMTLLLEGAMHDAAVGAFLVALRVKGETATELAGFARAMREHMVTVDAGAEVIFSAGPIPGGALMRVAGESTERVRSWLGERMGFLEDMIGEDPWSRRG